MSEPQNAPAPVKSFLAPAILVTIFCCWPFGIPAIVFAARTNAAINKGDLKLAAENSAKAKTWTLVSFIVGLVVGLIYFLISVIGAACG